MYVFGLVQKKKKNWKHTTQRQSYEGLWKQPNTFGELTVSLES